MILWVLRYLESKLIFKIYGSLSKQIIVDHIRKEVKAIRTAGSNADWQL